MPTITLHFSESLVRRVVKAFWWRTVGPLYLLVMALLSLYLGYAVWRGDRSWKVGLAAAVVIFGIAMAVAVYVTHYRGTLARFRRMKIPEAVVELDDERVRVRSDAGASEMPWSTLTEIWRFPDFWLLMISKAQFFTLPTADLNDDTREFILARARAHGVKVS
ncbi:MAG: YcxB family protein [Pirellulales bacterium]